MSIRFIICFILLPILATLPERAHAQDPAKLYFSSYSSSSWRVRLALEYRKIPYKIVDTDPLDNVGYLNINPMGKVPSLEIDGKKLTQSVAILEYLEETREAKPLLPRSPEARAKVREIVQIISADIQPLQNGAVLEMVPESNEWARFWIERGFNGLEKTLEKSSGQYSVGDTVTMADVFLLPQVRNARKYGVNLNKYPNIVRIERNLKQVDAFHEFEKWLNCSIKNN